MSAKRILSVGQCMADHASLTRALAGPLGLEVVPADTTAEALRRLSTESFDLVLVNRVFDADGGSGVDLIRRLKGGPNVVTTPVMLVSNYEDAQKEAEAAGAAPGFGKAALRQPRTLDRVRAVLDGR